MYVKKGIWNEEKEGYPVVLQVLHDLHCVVSSTSQSNPEMNITLIAGCHQNMLRKSLYYNYDYYKQYVDHEKEPEIMRKAHIST